MPGSLLGVWGRGHDQADRAVLERGDQVDAVPAQDAVAPLPPGGRGLVRPPPLLGLPEEVGDPPLPDLGGGAEDRLLVVEVEDAGSGGGGDGPVRNSGGSSCSPPVGTRGEPPEAGRYFPSAPWVRSNWRIPPVDSRFLRTPATVSWFTPSDFPIQRFERPGFSRNSSAMTARLAAWSSCRRARFRARTWDRFSGSDRPLNVTDGRS